MDQEKIVALQLEFSGRTIIRIPEENPSEVVVEIRKTEQESEAVALIDLSAPHVHRRTTEVYIVEEGELTVHVNRVAHVLTVGKQITILPGEVHWAKGNAARIRVIAMPPWTPEDHILV